MPARRRPTTGPLVVYRSFMMGPEKAACIVCENDGCVREPGVGDFARYDCPRCGIFVLTGSAEAELPGKLAEAPQRRSRMSHIIRRMQRPGEPRHAGMS